MHAQLACPLMRIQYCTEDHFSVNALLEYLSVLYIFQQMKVPVSTL